MPAEGDGTRRTALLDELRQFAADADDLAGLGDVLERLRVAFDPAVEARFDREAIWRHVDDQLSR